jgi:hypothetical protein
VGRAIPPEGTIKKLDRLAKYHSDAEVERALTLVATHSGQYRKVARMLAEDGFEISERTLREWVKRHPELYQQIRDREAPRLRKQIAHANRDLITKYMEMEHELADRLRDNYDNLDARDIAPTMRNVGVNKGIAADTTLKMEAQDQVSVPALEEFESITLKWRRKGIVVEGSASEEPKQVPSEVG